MPIWEKTKHGSKSAFDKGWAAFEKLGVPVNKLTNKIGSEAFWPTGLGAESDKAARILKSFCKDGFYKEQSALPSNTTAGTTATDNTVSGTATSATTGTVTGKPPSPGPRSKPKVLVKIPQKVIQNAVGLAIFSVMRTGLWVSGAGGSGVLIARKEDGNWGPPSGILVHTLGVGFMAGIDIYDCVIVINNREALEAFSKVRVSLGGELSVVAGPLGAGGVYESELLKNRKPVFSYVKSRGLYGGLQIDGTIIVERNDENAKFYGERLPIKGILAGHVKHIPKETHMLMEIVKQAEGRTDVDPVVLEQANHIPPPSDVDVESLSEPTQDQKNNFAPPPHYGSAQFGAAPAPSTGYPPEKQGLSSHPTHNPSAAGYGASTGYPPEKQGLDSHPPHGTSAVGYGSSTTHEEKPAYPPRPYEAPPHGHYAPGAEEKIPAPLSHDPSLYDPPTPIAASEHSAYPLPLNVGKPIARTDSGFAPPPGPPPNRTNSGFAPPPGPPPGHAASGNSAPHPSQPSKRDPDGPPGYS